MRNLIIAILMCITISSNSNAITIRTHFLGGTAPTNTYGAGDLQTVFEAAARAWEGYIQDEYVVDVSYGWATIGAAAEHRLNAQGGTPSRETAGTILFQNNWSNPGIFRWYLDPTPGSNEEWRDNSENLFNFGGGSLLAKRTYSGAIGDVVTCVDLYSTALHMLGYAFGLSQSNSSFQARASNTVVISAPRPFSGSIFPMSSNFQGAAGRPELPDTAMSGPAVGRRALLTDVDVLLVAEMARFVNITLPSQTVP